MANKDKLWCPSTGNDLYKNPIVFADYSDPDVIRVDDMYYMTASSFNYVPGLPILVSKDLINWEIKNYATGNIDYDGYEVPQHSKGIWAPSIRYHDEKFYIYYGMPDEGIFVVTATDPLGEWSKPHLVLEGKGLIDPCPFWEGDKAYIIHAYANSRIGFKSRLGIFPMSIDGMTAVGEDHFLYCNLEKNPTIEGPKVYKRGDYYYILAPAGGVVDGWQTALRSRDIMGPYEEMTVLRMGNTNINGPHQGGLVDTPDGEEYFIHFQQRGLYGRILHMQPVIWRDDWPVMGAPIENEYCGSPVDVYNLPEAAKGAEPLSLQASDDFDDTRLNLMWQWMGNCREDFYSLKQRQGHLRLFCLNPSGDKNISIWRSANVLTQKIVTPYFDAKVMIRTDGLKRTESDNRNRAGIAIIGGDYAYLELSNTEDGYMLIYGVSAADAKGPQEIEMASYHFGYDLPHIILAISYEQEAGKPRFRMGYILPSGEYGTVIASYAFKPSKYNWVGAKLGVFALGEGDGSYADFDYIHVKPGRDKTSEY